MPRRTHLPRPLAIPLLAALLLAGCGAVAPGGSGGEASSSPGATTPAPTATGGAAAWQPVGQGAARVEVGVAHTSSGVTVWPVTVTVRGPLHLSDSQCGGPSGTATAAVIGADGARLLDPRVYAQLCRAPRPVDVGAGETQQVHLDAAARVEAVRQHQPLTVTVTLRTEPATPLQPVAAGVTAG